MINPKRMSTIKMRGGWMSGMTTQERYDDISKLSGLSEEIVRRVLVAERESIVNSLKRGERSTLIGRCVVKPRLKQRLAVGGKMEGYIGLNVEITQSLKAELAKVKEFEMEGKKIDNGKGIRLRQIQELL